jgi:uncharacterized membrane protein YedE/YeeE
MTFESFVSAQNFFIWSGFIIAFVMGAVVNKTNFCTMGAVSDWVNMGDTSRFRAWMLAIAVAIVGVTGLEALSLATPGDSFPPYRGGQLIWAENLLGGLLFGIGMTLASGCGNKNLIRAGAGNIKSIMVLAIIGVIAYFMLNPFPNSDATLMSLLFFDWIRPLAIDVGSSQDLGALLSTENAGTVRMIVGGIIAAGLGIYIFMSAEFRGSFDNLLAGLVVGIAVVAAWYITSNVTFTFDEESYGLRQFVQEWEFLADSDEGKPADSRPLAAQSYTFINPIGQLGAYIGAGLDRTFLTFGIMAALGVIAGSFVWSLISKSFRIEWFASVSDFVNHFVGAILMGFGGTLAMGCTIGQGITGVSTLAVGSFIALVAIIFGCAITMKIQLYKMVYEDASIASSLVTGLADMRLLPSSMRKHDAV